MAETIQDLKMKVARLEAEVKRLNKLIDTRYKSGAKPVAESKLSSGQVLAISKLKAQNEALLKLLERKDAKIAEITQPKRATASTSTTKKRAKKNPSAKVTHKIHHFTLSKKEVTELAKRVYGENFKPKPKSAYKVGDRVRVLTGRKTDKGFFPSKIDGHISKINVATVEVATKSYGVWRSPFAVVVKL
jgi:hypothetical protein